MTVQSSKEISITRKAMYVIIICFSIVVCYLVFVRGIRFFAVPSESMEPTLIPDDYLATFSESEYERGDIVVFDDPIQPNANMVKRIIGIGGDRISIAAGALFINGDYLSEPYIKEPMIYEVNPPVTVPEGRVFVLGDNRNHSEDSSFWHNADSASDIPEGLRNNPTIPLESITGKVNYIYLPRSRAGALKSFPIDEMLP